MVLLAYQVGHSVAPGAVAAVGTVAAYVVPPSMKDVVKRIDDTLVQVFDEDDDPDTGTSGNAA